MKVLKTMNQEPLSEVMKYSESISTLKKLQDTDEESKNRPSSSIFKKGTSEFIRRKLMQQLGKEAYETGQF